MAQIRHDNALALFDEFVRQCARHPDPATLRGLERRFAEQLLIQPSYWSQIKSRSRQIGERLARQFEQRCRKPHGWMDQPHAGAASAATSADLPPAAPPAPDGPQNDDERFILGLVLTYYRRHPQRARTRLLDLLGEVLVPEVAAQAAPGAAGTGGSASPAPGGPPRTGAIGRPPAPPAPPPEGQLWQQAQTGVAPLKRKK